MIPENLPPKPESTGLPRNGEEEAERLLNAADVLLDAELERLYDRERYLRSQLAHIGRRIDRVRSEKARRVREKNGVLPTYPGGYGY